MDGQTNRQADVFVLVHGRYYVDKAMTCDNSECAKQFVMSCKSSFFVKLMVLELLSHCYLCFIYVLLSKILNFEMLYYLQ